MALSDFDLVLFGGSGDLAMRKLLPAMYARDVCSDLPPTARIICVGRDKSTQDEFLGFVDTHSKQHIKDQDSVDEGKWQRFLERITYVGLDATNVDTYAPLVEVLRKEEGITRVYYLATPPHLFAQICDNLKASGLATPACLLYTSPSPRDRQKSRMPSSA